MGPHWAEAMRFLETLREEQPWTEAQTFKLASDRESVRRYFETARSLGPEAGLAALGMGIDVSSACATAERFV